MMKMQPLDATMAWVGCLSWKRGFALPHHHFIPAARAPPPRGGTR